MVFKDTLKYNEYLVEVVSKGNAEIFDNLDKAKQKHPELNPQENTKHFTWAMYGGKDKKTGKVIARFEDWYVNNILSI